MPHSLADCHVLDIQHLIRRKAIVPGTPKTYVSVWIPVRRGELPSDGRCTVNSWYPTNGDPAIQIFMADGSSHVIHFRCIDRGVAKRWFFVAPNSETGELVRKLYRPRGAHSFDTRQAHNIPYPGRNLSKPDRTARQIQKLQAKLGMGEDVSIWSVPASKPPRMHTKTFNRCAAKLEELQWRHIEETRRLPGRPSKWFQSLGIGTMPRLGANRRSTGRFKPPRKGKMNAGDKAAIARAAASSPAPVSSAGRFRGRRDPHDRILHQQGQMVSRRAAT